MSEQPKQPKPSEEPEQPKARKEIPLISVPNDRDMILESFARHLMHAFDTWSERGFGAVADAYLARLTREEGEGRRGIEGRGGVSCAYAGCCLSCWSPPSG